MEIKSQTEMTFNVVLKINEQEARALKAISSYGINNLLHIFYEHLGKSHLQPHEKGCTSLFKTINEELPKHLDRIDKIKATFKYNQL